MKRIISSNEITIDSLVDRITRDEGYRVIVFYYSANKEYPVFLRKIDGLYVFVPPFVTSGYRYRGNSIAEILEVVTKARDVFVVEREDWKDIFKVRRGK